jgi:serine/threonine protein kinase
MERAAVTVSQLPSVVFRDGLGERRQIPDPTGADAVELLCLRSDLAAVPSFEFALRERVSRLAGFRHAYYGRVRGVERANDRDQTLTVSSDATPGIRLSTLLARAEERSVPLDINAALCLIRQLVPAVAMLHENAKDVAHGALGPERLVITPNARLVIVEYVLGAALEQLRYSQERYWSELRIALPRSAGLPRFDHRADVAQIGVVALSLILGRALREDEYPARVADVVAATWAVSPRGGFEPLPPGLRGWLGRALQLDALNSFASAIDARIELDKVLGDSDYIASPASLEGFLTRYQAAERPAARVAAIGPTPIASGSAAAPMQVPPSVAPAPAAALPAASPFPATPPPAVAAQPAPVVPPSAPSRPSTWTSHSQYTTPNPAPPPQPAAAKPASPQPPRSIPASAPVTRPAVTSAPPAVMSYAPAATPATPALPASVEPASMRAPMFDMHAAADFDSETTTGGSSRKWLWVAVAAVVVTAASAGIFASWRFFGNQPAAAATGTLVITTNPPGAQALVDGQPHGVTPVTLTLPAGAHTVELKGAGEPRSIPVTISAGMQVAQYVDLPREAAAVGQLQVKSEPSGARVSVDGTPRGLSPVMVAGLAPGEHTVVLAGDAGEVKQTVTIESGATASLVVPMSAAAPAGPASGWLTIGGPFEVQLFEHGELLGSSKADRIMVAAGRHDFDLVNDALGFRMSRSVQVPPGKVANLSVEAPKGTIALNAQPWAEVWIDGEKVGETPIGNYSIAVGPHDVVFRHPDLGEQHYTTMVTLKGPARLSVDLRKK